MREAITSKDGNTINRLAFYEWPTVHEVRQRFTEADPFSAFYWCAADGRAFGMNAEAESGGCIAIVEEALREIGSQSVYVIWKPKNATPSVWKRWQAKWQKETAV